MLPHWRHRGSKGLREMGDRSMGSNRLAVVAVLVIATLAAGCGGSAASVPQPASVTSSPSSSAPQGESAPLGGDAKPSAEAQMVPCAHPPVDLFELRPGTIRSLATARRSTRSLPASGSTRPVRASRWASPSSRARWTTDARQAPPAELIPSQRLRSCAARCGPARSTAEPRTDARCPRRASR
jgi:hypothetical protein